MSRHYDKNGMQLGLLEWAHLFEQMEYRRIGETELPSGYLVSTVWLGIDHRFGGGGPPLIFETMVFNAAGVGDQDIERYATLQEAVTGHERMCLRWANGRPAWRADE